VHELLLCDMPEMLDVLYRDVDAATRRVWIECYIYRNDDHGSGFAERLAAAAARGLDVRLLYDPLGSQHTDPEFFESICQRGVSCRPYRPHWPELMRGRISPRNHSRSFIADDAAVTGGAAFGKAWAPKEAGGEGWHDINVRVTGPVVVDFATLFEMRWREAEGDIDPGDFDTGDRYPDLRLVGDTPDRNSIVYETHVERIERARQRVWLANAYFVPPPPMVRALAQAAARGVDVRIILPGVSDLPLMRRAARSEYGGWLDAGMKIFEYQEVVMHSKYAVIDDDWSTVGSFNANSTSLAAANELNLFVFQPEFAERCAAQLEKDLARSLQITPEMTRERGFLEQAGDQLASDAMAVVDMVLGPRDPR
jgi:cardiolipin synthase A/B